ncbi:hypothetical protein H1V43_24330 [Streptomyces sp. PSKA54]|uniref:Uncharacterized protein n=1 Tax=Streptomyces himalayensis subsp. aureolus TaxID=2758039 RepID=A0A7W2D448_9ACTN|nr:hypothetical protein [Streptomyces himalayensis]MBA4864424.1 hypothetical protein [Streptomyces himalayensis subsp. aureolus]
MHPETHLTLHRTRAAELSAEADAHRLAVAARQPRDLRVRVGWTLVEVGLRLAAAPLAATSPARP